MRFAKLALLAVLSLSMASCSVQLGSTQQEDLLMRTDWQATLLGGVGVVTPTPVTLTFNEGRGSGRSGCNYYSGAVEYSDGNIKFGNIISTKMACIDGGVMQFEQNYLNALQSARRYSYDASGNLVVSGNDVDIQYKATPRQIRP